MTAASLEFDASDRTSVFVDHEVDRGRLSFQHLSVVRPQCRLVQLLELKQRLCKGLLKPGYHVLLCGDAPPYRPGDTLAIPAKKPLDKMEVAGDLGAVLATARQDRCVEHRRVPSKGAHRPFSHARIAEMKRAEPDIPSRPPLPNALIWRQRVASKRYPNLPKGFFNPLDALRSNARNRLQLSPVPGGKLFHRLKPRIFELPCQRLP